jgi:hypothetical protein
VFINITNVVILFMVSFATVHQVFAIAFYYIDYMCYYFTVPILLMSFCFNCNWSLIIFNGSSWSEYYANLQKNLFSPLSTYYTNSVVASHLVYSIN